MSGFFLSCGAMYFCRDCGDCVAHGHFCFKSRVPLWRIIQNDNQVGGVEAFFSEQELRRWCEQRIQHVGVIEPQCLLNATHYVEDFNAKQHVRNCKCLCCQGRCSDCNGRFIVTDAMKHRNSENEDALVQEWERELLEMEQGRQRAEQMQRQERWDF